MAPRLCVHPQTKSCGHQKHKRGHRKQYRCRRGPCPAARMPSPPAGQCTLSLKSELDGDALTPDHTARGKGRVQAHAFWLTLPRCPARLRPRDSCQAVWLLVRSQPHLGCWWTSVGSTQVTETHVYAKAPTAGIRPKYTQSPLVDQNVAHPTWFSFIANKSKGLS